MADKCTPHQRSRTMSRIRSSETKPEVMVRKTLWAKGYRYHKNWNLLPGRPDIVLPKYKTVILIHGCFWHHHENCSNGLMPKSNKQYWCDKFLRNKLRDEETRRELENLGWQVIVIWECEIEKDFDAVIAGIQAALTTAGAIWPTATLSSA